MNKRRIGVVIGLVSLCFLIYAMLPFGSARLDRNYSQVIMANDSSFLRVFLNKNQQWCLPPQLQRDIPQKLRTSTLNYEDQYFELHPGVNPVGLVRAVYLNIKHQRIVSGGSTVTMQLARMIRNKPRTFVNKIIEIFLALKIELWYSKEEILNDYLHHAPYGSNVRGYQAASYRFFDKAPDQLTWAEAATLAVLPNAPSLIFPSKNHDRLKEKRDVLLRKMNERGIINQETYELSLLEPVPMTITPFPLAAPHLTERIHQENQLPIVRTTINADIQYDTNFFVKQHSSVMQQFGVENVCALVVDNTTSEVVSYVGSQDFNDLTRNGRVDGVISDRSSGSILKPYLYALAIDDGLILPQTLIKDVPTYFESFSPSNASEKFAGIVPASQALIHSLNIPAVRLLNAYGVNKFYNLLEQAGVGSLFRDADDYGLPLILGGAEVNPWDMARLYMGMANGGQFSDLSYLPHQAHSKTSTLVSPEACRLILEEMTELIRPGLEFYWKKYSNQKPIAWKTGTSYGHKDAWAVGTTPKWTIVVWVGNFDGTSNNVLSGMQSAGPLLFNILKVLPEDPEKRWFEENELDNVSVKVCTQSGFYPSPNCPEVREVKAPIQMKPLKTCPFHKTIFTDKQESHEVCSYCWEHDHKKHKTLSYPPDVMYYLRKSGFLADRALVHNPTCTVGQEQDILKIIYPLENANIFVPRDFDGKHQAIVSRIASKFPERELFWYLNDNFLGSTVDKASLPLDLKSGKHRLTVIDGHGNKDSIEFSAIMK